MENEIVGQLNSDLGKNYIDRLYSIYTKLWEKKYGLKPVVSYPIVGKIAKELIEHFTEKQIAFLLIIYFEWKGASGSDRFIEKKLENSTHSIFLFKNEIDPIRAYTKNVLKIDLDKEDKIDEHIFNILNKD